MVSRPARGSHASSSRRPRTKLARRRQRRARPRRPRPRRRRVALRCAAVELSEHNMMTTSPQSCPSAATKASHFPSKLRFRVKEHLGSMLQLPLRHFAPAILYIALFAKNLS